MWVVLVALAAMLGSGVWIGVTLAITGTILLYFFAGGESALVAVPIAAYDMLYKFTWVAIPLYILLGMFFVTTGLSEKLYTSVSPLLGKVPGRLLLSNVVACAIFGAISGSSMATAAAVGSVAYPELERRGYDRSTVVGSLAGSGTLGLLVPPSIILIVYGAWQDVSIRALFIAALIPAVMMTSLFVVYLMILTSLRPKLVPPHPEEQMSLWRAILATRGMWPVLILITSVIGTIYLGVATPIEAAGIAVVIAVIMSVGFRTFSFKNLFDAALETTKIMGMIAIILIGAMILTVAVAVLGLPRTVVLFLAEASLHPAILLGAIFMIYLVLGCFFEGISMMLMTLPFVFPIVTSMGYDPIWLGVMLVMLTEAAMITPPVGSNLYVLHGITRGEVSILGVVAAAFPYFLLLLVGLVIITLFPEMVMWLPMHVL